MGVPAFFRWLSKKYPQIVISCIEDNDKIDQFGNPIPVRLNEPNPNRIEFDNLYLDMNGIIHPCTHPENKPAPKTEEEMFCEIFLYIDRLMAICRPRRLLYMAVDGVAPRAKMNQQRSRRFRASQEASEKRDQIRRFREEIISRGGILPPLPASGEHFDSNCITPGTPFMTRLATALRYYIHERLHNNPGWSKLQVILSDANVPGEGEHKIMDFIRRQRAQPDHDPNTHHLLCGADADLIMLGLATHEPHFTIIREEFKPNQSRPCEVCLCYGHESKECTGLPDAADLGDQQPQIDSVLATEGTEFIFIRIDVLREYLAIDLAMPNLPFPYDFERVIDDWVLMCFFVGNDFLPHLPSLEIRENAIDRLICIYKDTLAESTGWLTENGAVSLPRVERILRELGQVEDKIFQSRRQNEERFRERQRGFKRRSFDHRSQTRAPESGFSAPRAVTDFLHTSANRIAANQNSANHSSAASLREELTRSRMSYPGASGQANKRKADSVDDDEQPAVKRILDSSPVTKEAVQDEFEKEDAADCVRLWEGGWRERYYSSKFGVDICLDPDFPLLIAEHYVRGIAWVLAYYYQGCVSWKWYYPFHYAPFASDFGKVSALQLPFFNYLPSSSDAEELKRRSSVRKRDRPFRPLEQLMAVFPAGSGEHVPAVWRDLMTDSESPIIDQYPVKFRIDLNGKKFLWQGVALLPFVDEKRLKKAVKARYHLLTEEELARNSLGSDSYFVRSQHPAANQILAALESRQHDAAPFHLDPKLTHGIAGLLAQLSAPNSDQWAMNGRIESPLPHFVQLWPSIDNCQVVQVDYADLTYLEGFVFPARLLPGLRPPERVLKGQDLSKLHRSRSFSNDQDTSHRDLAVPRSWGPRQWSPQQQGYHHHHSPGNNDWRPRLGFGAPERQYRGMDPHSNYSPRFAQRVLANNNAFPPMPWMPREGGGGEPHSFQRPQPPASGGYQEHRRAWSPNQRYERPTRWDSNNHRSY